MYKYQFIKYIHNMKGLYMLHNNVTDEHKTIKIGMSMRLHERIFDYCTHFNNNEYYYCFITPKLERIHVLYIEKLVLDETKEMRNNKFGIEYRLMDKKYTCKTYYEIIIKYLEQYNVEYKVLEYPVFKRPLYIDTTIENAYIEDELNALNYNPFENIKEDLIKPNEQQENVLNMIKQFYNKYDIGKLIWSCGLGKTLLSIMICKKLHYKKIVVGVPSIYLQKQFYDEIKKIFPNEDNILCIGGGYNATTNQKEIISFIQRNTNVLFIITTYTSCNLLIHPKIKFDFKIGDEAHHLTGIENEETKGFKLFHQITSTKSLYMTATEKTIESKTNKVIYSMNDEGVFGKLIDEKSVNWAIEHKKITDYNLLILSNTEKEIDAIIKGLNIKIMDKNLFISAFMALKSMDKYNDLSHILICCNTITNADIIKSYIDIMMQKNIFGINKKNMYNESLHSGIKKNMDNEIDKFKKSKYGIISSVYMFGEGFDLPKLVGVVFAENMESDIRIVQTALRPNRLDASRPNKKAYIILPYMECDDIKCDNQSFGRIRMIITKLRNVDEAIEHKIKIMKSNVINTFGGTSDDPIKYKYDFEDKTQELDKIKLRLIYSKALGSPNTEEQDEYNYVKYLNKELKIQSKEQYCDEYIKKNHAHYIDKPDEYFRLKGVWNNWYDFIGLKTMKYIKTKNEWLQFCDQFNVSSLECYDRLCEQYKCLPKNPAEFYDNFTSIPNELGFNKERRHKVI